MPDPGWGPDPHHPILAEAWTYEIVGLRLERAPAGGAEPYLDLTVRRGSDRRTLRFWSPQDLSIEEGGPRMTHGLVISDLRARQLDGLGVRVGDFEASRGSVHFNARTVEALASPESEARYGDRFLAATYRDDEPVALGLAQSGGRAAPEWLESIPERLFDRIQSIARGYELHLLPVIHPQDETRLSALQCATLLEECDLLARLVDDPLLRETLGGLRRVAHQCVLQSGRVDLVVEGP